MEIPDPNVIIKDDNNGLKSFIASITFSDKNIVVDLPSFFNRPRNKGVILEY